MCCDAWPTENDGMTCCGALLYCAFPDWFATMVHRPTPVMRNVLLLMRAQTLGERLLNTIGIPDRPPLAVTMYAPPYTSPDGTLDVNAIVCAISGAPPGFGVGFEPGLAVGLPVGFAVGPVSDVGGAKRVRELDGGPTPGELAGFGATEGRGWPRLGIPFVG